MRLQLSERILGVLAAGGEMSRMEMANLCQLPYDSLRKPLEKSMGSGHIPGCKRAVKNISQLVCFYHLPGEPHRVHGNHARIESYQQSEPEHCRILRTLGHATSQETGGRQLS